MGEQCPACGTRGSYNSIGRFVTEEWVRMQDLRARVAELETSVAWYSGRHEEDDKIIDGLEAKLNEAYEAGWIAAAKRSGEDHLIADTDSKAYAEERNAALAKIKEESNG